MFGAHREAVMTKSRWAVAAFLLVMALFPTVSSSLKQPTLKVVARASCTNTYLWGFSGIPSVDVGGVAIPGTMNELGFFGTNPATLPDGISPLNVGIDIVRQEACVPTLLQGHLVVSGIGGTGQTAVVSDVSVRTSSGIPCIIESLPNGRQRTLGRHGIRIVFTCPPICKDIGISDPFAKPFNEKIMVDFEARLVHQGVAATPKKADTLDPATVTATTTIQVKRVRGATSVTECVTPSTQISVQWSGTINNRQLSDDTQFDGNTQIETISGVIPIQGGRVCSGGRVSWSQPIPPSALTPSMKCAPGTTSIFTDLLCGFLVSGCQCGVEIAWSYNVALSIGGQATSTNVFINGQYGMAEPLTTSQTVAVSSTTKVAATTTTTTTTTTSSRASAVAKGKKPAPPLVQPRVRSISASASCSDDFKWIFSELSYLRLGNQPLATQMGTGYNSISFTAEDPSGPTLFPTGVTTLTGGIKLEKAQICVVTKFQGVIQVDGIGGAGDSALISAVDVDVIPDPTLTYLSPLQCKSIIPSALSIGKKRINIGFECVRGNFPCYAGSLPTFKSPYGTRISLTLNVRVTHQGVPGKLAPGTATQSVTVNVKRTPLSPSASIDSCLTLNQDVIAEHNGETFIRSQPDFDGQINTNGILTLVAPAGGQVQVCDTTVLTLSQQVPHVPMTLDMACAPGATSEDGVVCRWGNFGCYCGVEIQWSWDFTIFSQRDGMFSAFIGIPFAGYGLV